MLWTKRLLLYLLVGDRRFRFRRKEGEGWGSRKGSLSPCLEKEARRIGEGYGSLLLVLVREYLRMLSS